MLFNEYAQPNAVIEREAVAVHKITPERLTQAATFGELPPRLTGIGKVRTQKIGLYWWARVFKCRVLMGLLSLEVTSRDLRGRIDSMSRRSLSGVGGGLVVIAESIRDNGGGHLQELLPDGGAAGGCGWDSNLVEEPGQYSSEQGTDCVEACPQPGVVHIRDSKQNAENGPHVTFPLTAWASFTQQIAGRPSA
ncbi:DUF397 domain-containing protein [Streptomyces sp. NPDC001982]|uniref:DUF397 domain-containing protein n=1 Tax=Streptomyces sp. NPDC001982 TaxID=3154405 RepID=UPI0033239B83